MTTDDAEWVVANISELELFFHPWLNVIGSWLGYFLLGLMVYAAHKHRTLWKRAHDVFLILIFACFADLMQMRMHLFFIYNMEHKDHYWQPLTTTVAACTIGIWIFYLHFMITFVEAVVSMYRFIVRILGKTVNVAHIYIVLGIIFALQASLLFDSFLYGNIEAVVQRETPFPIFCTKFYALDDPTMVSKLATAATMAIAPLLSIIMMLKRARRGGPDSGVTAFTLVSSCSLAFLVYSYLFLKYGDPSGKYIPREYDDFIKTVLLAAYTVQYLRFPLLCLAALIMVDDIKGAMLNLVLRRGRKHDGRIIAPNGITNEAYQE